MRKRKHKAPTTENIIGNFAGKPVRVIIIVVALILIKMCIRDRNVPVSRPHVHPARILSEMLCAPFSTGMRK